MSIVFFRDVLVLSMFLGILTFFTGCNDDRNYYITESVEETTEESSEENTEESEVSLTGVWNFKHGGQIEIIKDVYGRYQITTFTELMSRNPKNKTFAVHPRIHRSDIFPQADGSVVISQDVNYTHDYDIEEDKSGNNIQGKRLTVFTFRIKKGKLRLKIQIFSDERKDNPNFIHATRNFKGEL